MANRNTLRLDADSLIVLPRGLDRFWGFQSKIVIPLSSISTIYVEENPRKVRRSLRYPGLDAYWKLSGTFHPNNERHYWNYAGTGPALSIRLDGDQQFNQLYLSVADVADAQRMITEAIAHYKPR